MLVVRSLCVYCMFVVFWLFFCRVLVVCLLCVCTRTRVCSLPVAVIFASTDMTAFTPMLEPV